MDDSLIIDLFWRRSEDALTMCAECFGGYCRTIAINVLNSSEDAEECVNETWLKAWNSIPPTRPALLRAFLGKITRNIAINRYNAAHAQKRGGAVDIVLGELEDISGTNGRSGAVFVAGQSALQADEGEITHVINAFLRTEPERNADIFIKRYWYLQSVNDIAAEYSWSENKVASLLFRMRGRLKSKLESEGLL